MAAGDRAREARPGKHPGLTRASHSRRRSFHAPHCLARPTRKQRISLWQRPRQCRRRARRSETQRSSDSRARASEQRRPGPCCDPARDRTFAPHSPARRGHYPGIPPIDAQAGLDTTEWARSPIGLPATRRSFRSRLWKDAVNEFHARRTHACCPARIGGLMALDAPAQTAPTASASCYHCSIPRCVPMSSNARHGEPA